jgi:thioredoxin reductase
MAEPYDVECLGLLPVWDSTKEELLQHWSGLLKRNRIKVSTRETVEEIFPDQGGFVVRSSRRRYLAQRVVVSIGTRGRPRRLGVPGEELPKVTALLDDPARYAGRRVLVVGGGDSAVEAAVALGEAGARTTLSYRGRVLSRCRAKNRQALDEAVRLRRVELRFGTRVTEIREGQVVLESADGARVELGNDRVFTCIGGDAPVKWLASIGVRFSDQPHMARRAPTDRVVRRLIGAPEAPDQPTIVISLAG